MRSMNRKIEMQIVKQQGYHCLGFRNDRMGEFVSEFHRKFDEGLQGIWLRAERQGKYSHFLLFILWRNILEPRTVPCRTP